jgi:hypothetical protein
MSKRFIDTDIFDDSWFMNLSKDAKLLWIYCITNCNHAGIIKINKKLIEFKTGIKSFDTVSKDLANTLIILKGDKYFLPKFFKYQYPNYPEKSFRAADSAVNELRKYNLWDEKNYCILKTYQTVSKDLAKSASNSKGNSISKSSLEIRKEKFKDEIFRFSDYGNEILKEFFDYWAEPNRSKSKMRFEMEKTWDTSRRLKLWEKNSDKWDNGPKNKVSSIYQQTN